MVSSKLCYIKRNVLQTLVRVLTRVTVRIELGHACVQIFGRVQDQTREALTNKVFTLKSGSGTDTVDPKLIRVQEKVLIHWNTFLIRITHQLARSTSRYDFRTPFVILKGSLSVLLKKVF